MVKRPVEHGWWLRWVPLLMNFSAVMWGAATLSSDIRHLTEQVKEIQSGTITKSEFKATVDLLREESRRQDDRIVAIDLRVNNMEKKR